MGGDDHTLVATGHELAHALCRRPLGDALLVGARRAVSEARRAEPVDLDVTVCSKPARNARSSAVCCAAIHAPRPSSSMPTIAIRVPAHEARGDAHTAYERERLLRQRAPREVAAEDDEVGRFPLDLLEHRRERRRVAVDVRERRDANQLPRGVDVTRADAKRPPLGIFARSESALADSDLALNRSSDR